MNQVLKTLFALIGIGLFSGSPTIARADYATGTTCGVEAWAKKTLRDKAGAGIDIRSARATSIEALISARAPDNLDDPRRSEPVETTMWHLRARLVGYKLEKDGDYHLSLADEAGNTLIAEIPASYCVESHATAYRNARAAVDSIGGHVASNRWWWLDYRGATPPTVVVYGVGFFDFPHGADGAAPNAVELHPVVRVELAP